MNERFFCPRITRIDTNIGRGFVLPNFSKWRIEFFASYSRLFACFAGTILTKATRGRVALRKLRESNCVS
jgi:hypothetical protein